MKIGTTPFIAENIAPSKAKNLAIFNGNTRVGTVEIDKMQPQNLSTKLYSFGLVSDIHLYPIAAVEWTPEKKFRNALTYFQTSGCIMCIQCGDITQTGFYGERTSGDGATEYYFDDTQMMEYKTIREEYTMPTYGICGNHENYYGKTVIDHLNELEEVMGKMELSFTLSSAESTDRNTQVLGVGNDVFILCGQPSGGEVMSDSDFQWLGETLETNKDRRCFVFVHAYIEEDSGDPMDIRENSIFESWGVTKKNAFMNLLRQYKNAILFHGHSHMKIECQDLDKSTNYTDKNGFKSIHVPSLGVPRDVDLVNLVSVDDRYASEGYIVDVYDDCIVLNGIDFINNVPVPTGVFKIDTK